MSYKFIVAVLVGLLLAVTGPVRAEASPTRATETYEAAEWSDKAIELIVTNKKVIARCIGNSILLSYGALRALRAVALRDKIFDISSLAQGLYPPSCRTTVAVAKAALRLWSIAGRNGRSFTFRDDSKVIDIPFAINECFVDISVGDAVTRQVWRYKGSYTFCSPTTYGVNRPGRKQLL